MATEVSNIQRSYSIIPCFIFVELIIMAGTVLLAYYFECTDTFEVHVQGFFCQDADFMKPYPGPEEDSFIPPIVLYCVLAAAPTIIRKNISVGKERELKILNRPGSICGKRNRANVSEQ